MPIIIGVAVVAAGITGYLLRPHSAASQSPTAQSATASSVPSAQPAPPPGPKPVEQSALLGLLLTPRQITTAMGASAMTVAETITTMNNASPSVR
jgi:hypothetical protein